MPNPANYKDKNSFMKACIPIVLKEGTAKNNKHAVKICSSMWKRKIQSFERELKLQCYRLALSSEEIRYHIPINVMAEIKEYDPHPYFRAYSIMQNGIAQPKVIGEQKSLPTKWSTKIVQSLRGIIKRGVQFFIGHNADNSTNGRRSIGEVVGNFQKLIGEKLHNIVIGYFPDKIEADKYNVCSVEGTILAEDFDNYSVVKEIKNITGIALGNSQYDKPAFPGAVYLGAIQAFGDDPGNTPSPKNKKREEITMTFEEIKKAVRDMNIFPSQLFSEDDLKNDRTFGPKFDDVAKAAKEGMITKEEHDKLLNAEKEKSQKFEKKIMVVTAHDKLKKSLSDENYKGLTQSQRSFIDKKFKPENMETINDDTIKKFVDDSIKEYSEWASLFGNANNPNPQPKIDPNTNNNNDLDEIDKIVDEVTKEPQEV